MNTRRAPHRRTDPTVGALSSGALALLVAAAAIDLASAAGPPADATCWDCHESHSFSLELLTNGGSAARADSVRLTRALYERSVHGKAGLACVDCHGGIAAIPHPTELPPVRCESCHAAESAEHRGSIHGSQQAAGNPDAPACVDCHGTHGILRGADRASPTHKLAQTATCARCHADPAVAARNEIGMPAPLEAYAAGVHGEALLVHENENAPSCSDCHGAHDVRRASDPSSRVAKPHVTDTCGRCHGDVAHVFGESVHGHAVAQGNPDAPACNDCHGEHRIEPVASRASLVYPDNLARTTCVRCHESEVLAQRYGFPADRGATFRETYHGLAGELGGLPVANCASCHGVHDIFPSSDPRSTIAPANLQSTCGRCHPSASEEFTRIAVHKPATVVPGHPVTRATRSVYITLLVVVVGGMGLHNLFVWGSLVARKHAREKTQPRVSRFSRFEALEHMLLIVCFFGLVFTGFALKYSDALWVRWLARHGLDETMRSDLHRALGLMLIAISITHGVFLVATRRGRADLRALRPRRSDFTEFFGTLRYYLGRAPAKPRASRFDYAEKLEYLALLWGTAVMIGTGLILWYPANVTHWAPAWLVEVAEVIHLYEAWLAFLAILVWHFFFVMLHPEEAPLNTTFFDGKETVEKARRRD
jgi:cytochrome b subunit of formate dehydrogenase